jgi:N4-gp56 family major capsid protein
MINSSDGVGTNAVNACYIGIVHTNVSYTLKDLSGFLKVENYANKSDVMPGEIGTYGEVRFIETTNAKIFAGLGAGGVDVYATIIMGQQAYGISRISSEALKNIVKPLGSGGTSDPLDQRATSGWKATFVAKILNNDFISRIECGVVA